MLKIHIPEQELYDQEKNIFLITKSCNIVLEHSLVSISKWEEEWEKPFISNQSPTKDETLSYIKHMTITQNVPEEVYSYISNDIITKINTYIDRPMTATTFSGGSSKKNRDIITTELVYYWMIELNIPFECQKWHFNKLMTLIKVCSIKNSPKKKRSNREILSSNKARNQARLKQLNTTG